MNFFMIGLLLTEALDTLRVRLTVYVVCVLVSLLMCLRSCNVGLDVLPAVQQLHVHRSHELTAMDVQSTVTTADTGGGCGVGPVTSTSHDETPTSSFTASSTCMLGLASKRHRSAEHLSCLNFSDAID